MSLHLDLGGVLAGLKDFQRATVDHVVGRFFDPDDPARRFLVADEVGLGKTHVARGVIAHVLARGEQRGADRLDVVYVCANGAIARQNIRKLNVLRDGGFVQATRLTLLPLERPRLAAHRVNFLSLTPATSFNPRSAEGVAEERALLVRLLRPLWPGAFNHSVPKHVFRGDAGYEGFRHRLRRVDASELDEELAQAFIDRVEAADLAAAAAGEETLRDRFEDLKDRWRRRSPKRWPPGDRRLRAGLVAELRGHLAEACLAQLRPDLVILDEFQRFKHLLDPDTEAGELAEHLFRDEATRVLALSATPYRMYTSRHEGDEDHYGDFVATYRFLSGDDGGGLEADLARFRSALLAIGEADGAGRLREAKHAVEQRLRRVMSRTERLAVRTDRDGMLDHVDSPGLRLDAKEITQYLRLDELAQRVGVGGTLEYWKASPYLLSFMDDYVFARRLRAEVRADPEAAAGLRAVGALVPLEDLRHYARLDPDSARLRALLGDTVDRGAWRWLWMPPTRPHHRLTGPFDTDEAREFTKRLVFSGWHVVPKVVAALVSYEAERRMVLEHEAAPENTREARERHARLLEFGLSDGRLTGMPVLALLYPSPALAGLADPLEIGGEDASLAQVRAAARERVERALAPFVDALATPGEPSRYWYWAAALMLDQAADAKATEAWWSRRNLAAVWRSADDGEEAEGLWADHVDRARQLLAGDLPLGPPPDDLAEVVADLALAAPGVCALRALDRVADADLAWDVAARDAAGQLAWGFRTLFNLPEVTAMVRAGDVERPYWRGVLDYAVGGGLQAVLDEYAHVLVEWLGVADADDRERVATLSGQMHDALAIRTTRYRVHDLTAAEEDQDARSTLRGRFALRFGDRGEDGRPFNREAQERAAFNSPFWPFVLATTSIGQEGLDFHHYCHAVVHWNLPGNPVDLEQREGRVHRYKGHAVRKNVAARHGAGLADGGDVWREMFSRAAAERDDGEIELSPYWIYPIEGGARIERTVPAIPYSRDFVRLGHLTRALAAYRLVFGQPRQQDLISYLADRLDEERLNEVAEDLRIDLQPALAIASRG